MENGWQWLAAMGFPVAAAVLTRMLVLSVTWVHSRSMLPAIRPGARLLTLRVYRPERLKRGDIVVFFSHELGMTMVKRLIGLPGDVVQIEPDGGLVVNGNRQDETYVRPSGGQSGVYPVPSGEYFFLGDNRAESCDSRQWRKPTVPSRDIRGKVIY